ncbi:MAG: hypothetical protein Kow00121_59380 [Elainellaceae cyanobacterium]
MVRGQWQQANYHERQQASSVTESPDYQELPQLAAAEPIAITAIKPKTSAWLWLFVGLGFCCALGAVATVAFQRLALLPPTTNCQEISPLSPDIDRLYCAQQAAQSGDLDDLMASLALVEQWTPEHPLYKEAQRWMSNWSESVLTIARQKMNQNDFEGAVELAQRVPKSSPLYEQAQTTIAQWQQQWQADAAVYEQARTAIKNQDWDAAFAEILLLRESAYSHWSEQQANALSQQVLVEKQARRTLAEAKQLAATWELDKLTQAIAQVNQMGADTFTRADAQPLLTQWGNTLLKVGLDKWQAGQLKEAIALAQQVVPNPELKSEAQRLVTLSEARRLAIQTSTHWQTKPAHIWKLMEAIAAVRQIPAESRFYNSAQASLKSWSAQLQDVTQLQYAQVLADWGQRSTLQTAIAQAQQVSSDAPRRIQAQTLIAHWQAEIERLEDQPLLLYAQQVAAGGTIADLNAAIAEAGKISPERALRDDAQGLIYGWTRQIQTIEDQPLLAQARQQAAQGNWSAAIRTASSISWNRALYDEAQAAIGSWQAELWQLEARNNQDQSPTDRSRLESENQPDGTQPANFEQGTDPLATDKQPKLEELLPNIRRSPLPADRLAPLLEARPRPLPPPLGEQPAPPRVEPAIVDAPAEPTSDEQQSLPVEQPPVPVIDHPPPVAPISPQIIPPQTSDRLPLEELPLPLPAPSAAEASPIEQLPPPAAEPPVSVNDGSAPTDEPANPFDASLLPNHLSEAGSAPVELNNPFDASLLPDDLFSQH